eukprot:92961-Hanusia_phi.AAC.1
MPCKHETSEAQKLWIQVLLDLTACASLSRGKLRAGSNSPAPSPPASPILSPRSPPCSSYGIVLCSSRSRGMIVSPTSIAPPHKPHVPSLLASISLRYEGQTGCWTGPGRLCTETPRLFGTCTQSGSALPALQGFRWTTQDLEPFYAG